MDRLLTAPGRGLRDADAPQPGWPETPPAPPRNPDRAPLRAADRPPVDRPPVDRPPIDRHSFDGKHGGAAPARPDQRPARRVVFGVLVGALVMLAVATLDTFGGAKVPVLGSIAALPAAVSGAQPEEAPPPPPATPGTCLTWTRPDAADTQLVDCAKKHLFEQAGSVPLADQVALPDDQVMRQLVDDRCTPVVRSYLGGELDPAGRYRVGALKPSPSRWEDGDRELRCGLQSASRSGALYPLTGKAVGSDQSNVQEPGTCLAIDGKTIGDPVDCAGQHAVETVGVVDLGQKFPDAFPAVGDQDGFLQPECARIAGEYAGGADVISKKGLTVYWDNITEPSWAAGSRKVNCNLAALLPDRSGFAPVTGAVKGDVAVGAEPAPPVTNAPAAGVPAPGTAPAVTPDGGQPGDGEQPPADGQQPPADGQQPPADVTGGDQPQPTDGQQPPADGTTGAPATTTPPLVEVNPGGLLPEGGLGG